MGDTNSQISFADLAFMSQGIELDPVLKQILGFVQQLQELGSRDN